MAHYRLRPDCARLYPALDAYTAYEAADEPDDIGGIFLRVRDGGRDRRYVRLEHLVAIEAPAAASAEQLELGFIMRGRRVRAWRSLASRWVIHVEGRAERLPGPEAVDEPEEQARERVAQWIDRNLWG